MSGKTAALLMLAALITISFGAMALLAYATRTQEPPRLNGERFAAITRGIIRYEMGGSGECVMLFLHGFNQSLDVWDHVWRHLDQCPARRLRIDIPGFGASRVETNDYGLAAQADRIDEFLAAMKIDKAVVVGGSMGGSLAVAFAARHPERVDQLILLAPSAYSGALHRSGLLGRLTRPGAERRAAKWLAKTRIYKILFPRSAALQAATVTASYGPAWVDQLRQTKAPAFVVWSSGDDVASKDSAPKVVGAMPDGTLFWLDAQAGHDIPSTRPEFVAQAACLTTRGTETRDLPLMLSREQSGNRGRGAGPFEPGPARQTARSSQQSRSDRS